MGAGGEQDYDPQNRRADIRELRQEFTSVLKTAGGQVALRTAGPGDLYLSERSVIRSADRSSRRRRHQPIEDAGPWVQLDQSKWLSAVLLDFLGG